MNIERGRIKDQSDDFTSNTSDSSSCESGSENDEFCNGDLVARGRKKKSNLNELDLKKTIKKDIRPKPEQNNLTNLKLMLIPNNLILMANSALNNEIAQQIPIQLNRTPQIIVNQNNLQQSINLTSQIDQQSDSLPSSSSSSSTASTNQQNIQSMNNLCPEDPLNEFNNLNIWQIFNHNNNINNSSQNMSAVNNQPSLPMNNEPCLPINTNSTSTYLDSNINFDSILLSSYFPGLSDDQERDISRLEIAHLNDLSKFISDKGENGNTVVHKLAKLDQISFILSTNVKQILFDIQTANRQIEKKIKSHIFLECLVERVTRDQERFNQPSLLHNLINIRNNFDETPLSIAVQNEKIDFVKLLIVNNAQPNIPKLPQMHTVLHIVCMNGSINLFKILLDAYYLKDEYKSTINQLDKDGNTALMLAIKYHSKSSTINNRSIKINNLSIIKQLLETNLADKKIINFENNTCVHLLCENGDCSIEDKLAILNFLKTTIYELTEYKNIYGKNAWQCWNGLKIIDQPTVLLENAKKYCMQFI